MEKKFGRPRLLYDEKQGDKIKAMRQFGLTLEQIAILEDISVPTLKKLYGRELKKGDSLASLAIGRRIFEKAMAGDTAAMIFWAKSRMGWRENSQPETRIEVNTAKASAQVKLQIRELYGLEELP